MSPSLKAILLLALVCFASAQYDDHEHDEMHCDHDAHQEQNPPELLDIEEDFRALESGRFLADSDYPNMRIYANYDNLIKTASASYASYIKDELVPGVISYFQATLKVKIPVSGNLVLSSSVKTLCDLSTPAALRTGVPADYAYLVTTKSESGSVMATSWNCNLASGTKRPLVGSTSFNRNVLKEANGDAIRHEKNMYLLMHEMMHTFGFSKSLHKYFIDASGKTLSGHVKSAKIGGQTLPVIDIPSLTERLRTFHGCSTLPGAIMASGDASHWNKKFYLYETMQSGSIDGKRISELSLALLEASGWYAVDYTKAEPYFYGQGQGCDFINGVCSSSSSYKPAFEEFCGGSSKGCNFMGNSGASCNSGSNMGNCKYMLASSSNHCEGSGSGAKIKSIESYGRDSGSRCFTGTLNTKSSSSTSSYCFQYNCVGEGTNTQLEVLLGTKKALCSKEGTATVDGYYGVINCPDPMTFCNTVGKRFCPKSCLGRGACVDNKCICDPGFKGIDCAFRA